MKTSLQIKISVSKNLHTILSAKAEMIGLPLSHYIKYLLIKDVENSDFPFSVSEKVLHSKEHQIANLVKKSFIDDVNSIVSKMDKSNSL